MDKKQQFDYAYAMRNTEVILTPSRRLETFGHTVVNYLLLSELMDSVNQVRIREGRIKAHRPEIITPQSFGHMLLDGFGDEARKYADFLQEHERDLVILQYGFVIRKEDIRQYVVHEKLASVVDQIKQDVQGRNDPLSAIVVGVDKPWEVSLVKLMVEVMQKSVPTNVREMQQRNLLPKDPEEERRDREREIEQEFKRAKDDPSRISHLGEKLQEYGVFEEYEDRFFNLLKSSR